MPSATSIEKQQYYAHPRNQFWPIVGTLFEIDCHLPYTTRCSMLLDRGVAVWDVLAQCVRKGSLDADIVASSVKPNDIASLVTKSTEIKHIFFNGQKAQQLYQRYIQANSQASLQNIECTRLPSTSPAHAAISLAEKLAVWKIIAEKTQ